jgi:hypothetical protein
MDPNTMIGVGLQLDETWRRSLTLHLEPGSDPSDVHLVHSFTRRSAV